MVVAQSGEGVEGGEALKEEVSVVGVVGGARGGVGSGEECRKSAFGVVEDEVGNSEVRRREAYLKLCVVDFG